MKNLKKIIFAIICIVSTITSITLVTFADVVDKGSYTFDTETGVVTPKAQSILMERYPLPIEDGRIVHNGAFTTIGKELNYQLDITLLSSYGSKTISFAFPSPDHTKSYAIEFGGGEFQVWLLPQLKNADGSIYYHLQTISYTNEGDFGYFYDNFYADIVEKPNPGAFQSISNYVIKEKNEQLKEARENEAFYYTKMLDYQYQLNKSNEALEQGNWFMSFFDGIANSVLTFINTIGTFEVGGISVIKVITVAIIIIVLFIVIKVVRA